MSAGAAEETEKPESTSKKFTHGTDELAFTQRHYDLSDTRVYFLRPPKSLSSTDRPWIIAHITTADYTLIFRHPLTSKHHSFNLPPNFHISILNPITLSAYYAFREPYSVDKLLVLPTSPFPYESIDRCALFALYGGGQLQGCPRYIHRHPISPWVKLTSRYRCDVKFDDIVDFQNKVYAIDRQGITNLVNHYKTVTKIRVGKTLIFESLTPGSGQFGWRKRFAVNGETLYVVVRTEEKLFKVFRLKSWVKTPGRTCYYYWDRVKRFKGNKVLFMARDHYFFRKALRKFPGREYRNCIVFSEAAFPQYGNGCWEFTQCDDRQFSEDDIAVFRLGDEIFAREEEWENSGFPKIDWSPPDWIFNVSSFPAGEFNKYPESESSSLSVREPDDDDEGFDFDTGGKNDGEVQSNLKNSKSKDEEEQEEMQSDFSSHDQDQGVVESDSESKDQEDEKMQCDEEMHSKEVNIEGDEPLQKDPVTPSRFAVEEEVRRTLVRMNSGNEEMEEETSGKNITHTIPKACTSSKTEETETPESTSKKFTHRNNELAFPQRPYHHYTTEVCLLQPPKSLSSLDRFWIVAFEIDPDYKNLIFRHPLTSKPHSVTLPENFYFPWLKPFTFSTYYAFEEPYSTDKLLALPTPISCHSLNRCTLFALYGGGQLQGCPRYIRRLRSTPLNSHPISPWVKLTNRYRGDIKFDDIVEFQDKVYAIDRQGITNLIDNNQKVGKINMGKTLIYEPLTPGSGQFGWRKRFMVNGETLYVVVRTEEKLFKAFRLKSWVKTPGRTCFYWDRVKRFKGNKVFFVARDHYFFRRASRKFPGKEYTNCIVFSEAAFPQYGNGCWDFTQSDDRQFSEDDIAVFRLGDERFAREEEWQNSGFPKIDWSPPDWIFNLSSFTEDGFKKHSESESSSSQSEREPDNDEGLDSHSVDKTGDKNVGEVQSDLKDTNSKDEGEQEEMETEFSSHDQAQGGIESVSESKDEEDKKMQCDSNSREKEDEEMHSKEAVIEGDAPLQKDPVTPSRSAVEKEVTTTPLRMNSGNDALEEGTSVKNMTQAIPKASTSSRTESHKSDSATTKFEGLDIRSDLVPTLQKIRLKHGNIIKDSIVRSGDIVARALESLAIMVRILEDNPAQSLSDSQTDYLTSTLSDLRNICFKVYWLVSFVEKALKVHRSKPLVESLNNLSQLSSQVKERRAILLSELANLDEEENKLKEEMAKVSKRIPFSGQVKFDEPIGAGLTE